MSFATILQGVETELSTVWSEVEAAAEQEAQSVIAAMTGVVKQFTPQGIAIVQGLVSQVKQDAGSGSFSIEEILTRVLNLGSAQGHTFLQTVESAAIQALIASLHFA